MQHARQAQAEERQRLPPGQNTTMSRTTILVEQTGPTRDHVPTPAPARAPHRRRTYLAMSCGGRAPPRSTQPSCSPPPHPPANPIQSHPDPSPVVTFLSRRPKVDSIQRAAESDHEHDVVPSASASISVVSSLTADSLSSSAQTGSRPCSQGRPLDSPRARGLSPYSATMSILHPSIPFTSLTSHSEMPSSVAPPSSKRRRLSSPSEIQPPSKRRRLSSPSEIHAAPAHAVASVVTPRRGWKGYVEVGKDYKHPTDKLLKLDEATVYANKRTRSGALR
jgi:hypothetical protein